jgi:hypothetical protein
MIGRVQPGFYPGKKGWPGCGLLASLIVKRDTSSERSTEENEVDRQKVIGDSILVTRDSILLLQRWLGLLERWRETGQAEPNEFIDACRQMKEAQLWHWARQAGGHGLEALTEAVQVQTELLEQVHLR